MIVAIAILHNICKKMNDPMPPIVPDMNDDSIASDEEISHTVARNDDCNRSHLINNYFSRLRQ